MAKIINIHCARAQLSRLVEQSAAGKEYIIVKAGRPRAPLDERTLALFER